MRVANLEKYNMRVANREKFNMRVVNQARETKFEGLSIKGNKVR